MRVSAGREPIRSAIAIVLVALTFIVSSKGTEANYRLCFTQVVGLPITNPNQPPTIDGVTAGDPGWTQAFRYVWGNGTAQLPNAAVQGIRDNTFLYLSIEVNNDVSLDDRDLIILAFSPTDGTSATDDRRIHIYPNSTNVAKGAGSNPRLVDYWTDSSHWNHTACTSPGVPAGCDSLASPKALPAGVSIAVSDSGSSGNYSWVVEMKIPLAAFDIPASGRFGFYVNAMRVASNGTANQYYWPSLSGNGVQILPEQHTPVTSKWGDATQDPALATSCKGVSLDWSDITSNHSSDQIDATPGNANTFNALLHNNSVDMNGSPISANNIVGTFSIANFGLSSTWTQIPVGSPAGRAGPISITLPSVTGTLTTSPSWNITDAGLIANYAAHPDQCIRVDLDSTASDCVANPNNCVSLLNKSVKRNMWVLTASEVSKKAEISAKGYGPPPVGRTEQEFELRVSSRQEVLKRGEPTFSKPAASGVAATQGRRDRVVSRLTWAVSGCRFTGEHITIKGKEYELCDDVGGFGAVVEHFGAEAVEKWLVGMEGPGLHDEKDSYRLRVPQDGSATVTVNFRPEEGVNARSANLALLLDAGLNLGKSGGTLYEGFSLNTGLEYAATSHFSVEGIFGYHHLAGGFSTHADLYQFSLNGKTYLSNGHVRPFINGGIGGYKFGGGSTYFGGNIGGGALFQFSTRVGAEASYNFHALDTSPVLKFSTVQLGLRFVF